MALTDKVKNDISQALNQYQKQTGLTPEQIGEKFNIYPSVIEIILRGETKRNKAPLQDSEFKKVAAAIKYRYGSEFWRPIETPQFRDIFGALLDAKVNGRVHMIIGHTGCGKTYAVNRFKMEFPDNTYVVTVNSMFKVNHIIEEFGKVLGVRLNNQTRDSVRRLKRVVDKIKLLKSKGAKPVLIIDEAENLNIFVLKMLKGLYDAIKEYCPVVLIGTTQLLTKLEKLVEKDADGMPQFFRRFEAGLIELEPVDSEFMYEPFFEQVEDENLKTLLSTISPNYGVLNDYLEPALRTAKEMNQPLTEKFFLHLNKSNRRLNRL